MNSSSIGAIFACSIAVAGFASFAKAQTAEPTYKADPSVYKLLFEDVNFRVIEATHVKGIHDKAHSHTGSFIVYNLSDCKMKTYDADGKATERDGKAGTVTALPAITSHSAENTGTADCKQIFVEKK